MTTETLPEVRPIEVVTPIKPSEAIRLGILRYPEQTFNVSTDGVLGACVLLALETGGGDMDGGVMQAVGQCPESGLRECQDWQRRSWVAIHLNDDHRWSRERIADWLAEQGL